MLTTNYNQSLSFYFASPTDSTVYVNHGVAFVDAENIAVTPHVLDFQGGYKTFVEMTHPQLLGYQYTVLCLQYVDGFADMTAVTFDPVDSPSKLTSPAINNGLKPLGLFLFYGDGTNITLTSSSRVQ